MIKDPLVASVAHDPHARPAAVTGWKYEFASTVTNSDTVTASMVMAACSGSTSTKTCQPRAAALMFTIYLFQMSLQRF